jgi:H+/Cl- antiporter ClcA
LLEQWLELLNNVLHDLIACAIAAAIAVSFNTLLPGGIISIEVIMMQYKSSHYYRRCSRRRPRLSRVWMVRTHY